MTYVNTLDELTNTFRNSMAYVMVLQPFTSLQMKIAKMINFARGLGYNYKTLRNVMLVKTPYPTFTQFVNALRGFDMREEEEEVP